MTLRISVDRPHECIVTEGKQIMEYSHFKLGMRRCADAIRIDVLVCKEHVIIMSVTISCSTGDYCIPQPLRGDPGLYSLLEQSNSQLHSV